MMHAAALVFVVEDDASLRASLQDLLESVGLRVAACASAQEFLHCPPPEGPSCLGLDVRLPGLSGLELQQELAYAGLLERTGWSTGRHGTWRPSCWGWWRASRRRTRGDTPSSREEQGLIASLRVLRAKVPLAKRCR